MIRRTGRLLGAAAVTFALTLGGVGAGATPAAATSLPLEQCTTTSGVVLAVDFSKWGGPLLRSCGTTPTTGYTLLNQGGWKTAGTGHDGPAFICRIGYSGFQGGKQYPTPDQEKCVLTPPATAYWSYWHADPGENSWSYSQLGAMSYQPKPGSVDLWIFGGTNIEGTEGRPTFSPDTVRAHNITPGGGPAVTPPPADGGTAGGSGSGSTGGAGGTNGGSGSTGGGGSTGSGSASGSTGGTSTGGSSSGTSTGSSGAATGATRRPPSAAGTGGSSGSTGSTGGRPAPASPPAGAPAPTTPEPEAPTTPTTPDETPAAQPSEAPPATETAGAAPTVTESPAAPVVAGGPVVMDAAPAADAPHDAGSMVPALVGTALVVALGVATVVAARRRRRQAE
ncbi:hypothetical protein ACWDRR_03805 [Kitasatospora sp. NPDC003701]